MSQSDQFDNYNGGEGGNDIVSDTYTAESRADIYNTPDVSANSVNEVSVEENVGIVDEMVKTVEDEKTEEMAGTAGEDLRPAEMLTGEIIYSSQIVPNDNPYEGSPSGNYFYNQQAVQNNSRYYSDPNANNPYIQNVQNSGSYSGQSVQNNTSYYSDSNANNPYMGQNAQNGNVYGGQPALNGNPYAGQYTQNGAPYTSQSTPNNNTYGNNPYTGQQAQGNYQYGSSLFTNNQYGNPPYGNNPYSPYAVPQKKSSTGLIIGIVVAVIVLFLVALGALTYKVVTLYSEEKNSRRNAREEYNFDDDWEKDRDRKEDRYDDNDDDYRYDDHHGDYYYDDDYDYNYDYDDTYNYDDDEYYTLHDDIKENLSYSVNFDYYEYDTSYENVDIMIFYPVIEDVDGSVPNVDKLNSTIQSEIDFLVEYFEDEYEDYFVNDEDGYFQATSTGYVTYMDEEKMSIVFSESIYSDYYYDAFLYSINIDMENGVILDNESMLNADDDFSVEFRQKSDIQNGEISYLTRMSDQEITDHFNSSDIIVFYTPHGMEIGFNYDEGWVTVTYRDYEQYLKVF